MTCDLDIYRTVCVRNREHNKDVTQQADRAPEAGNVLPQSVVGTGFGLAD